MPEKTKPAVSKVKSQIQEEIFLRLVEATANSGVFALGELESGEKAQRIAKHLRGVAEIVSSVYEE